MTKCRRWTAVLLACLAGPLPCLAQAPAADGAPVPPPAAGGALPPAPQAAPPADPTADPLAGIDAHLEPSLLPHDLSPVGMFLGADIIVQSVMVGLAVASVATWTVLLAKSVELASARRRQNAAYAEIDRARSLAEIQVSRIGGVTAALLGAARTELQLSADVWDDRDGVTDRTASRLARIEAADGRRMALGTGVVATIASTAPFVGLFGTVWGIMNAFIGISEAHTTNLAVVAPGIAEALLATALGLVAAIPAVVIYNHFARRIAACKARTADISAAILRLVSRDLSHRAAGLPAAHRRAAE